MSTEVVENTDITTAAEEFLEGSDVKIAAAETIKEPDIKITESEDMIKVEIDSKTDDNDTSSSKVIALFNNDEHEEELTGEEELSEEEEDKKILDWNEVTAINNKQIADGVKFGIGLAFLSIVLNGLTDDLLFNIPTSMLMWILTALGAAIECLPEEEVRRRNRR